EHLITYNVNKALQTINQLVFIDVHSGSFVFLLVICFYTYILRLQLEYRIAIIILH
ncbi:uncharacterized protein BX663DRAFT_463725, partial [Cokeromyces recurvatus]|uniref:uncharacterized protein n=1 Tax=Cokeromyces recurvatus TaxID=90255 RepID=UPI00221F0341